MGTGSALAQPDPKTNRYSPELNQSGKDVVWVPTPDALVDKMLDLAKVGVGDTVIDLGAGDGRLVIKAAQLGATALGIEYDEKLVNFARQAAGHAGVAATARFVRADLFTSDLSAATVITVFLGPQLNLKLLPKLLSLKPGTRIVSNTHPIGDWPADATAASTDDERSVFYRTARLWIVPAKVAGRWRWTDHELTLQQRYQSFAGTLKNSSAAAPLSVTALQGSRISFEVSGTKYAGTVDGAEILGTIHTNGLTQAWRARRAP